MNRLKVQGERQTDKPKASPGRQRKRLQRCGWLACSSHRACLTFQASSRLHPSAELQFSCEHPTTSRQVPRLEGIAHRSHTPLITPYTSPCCPQLLVPPSGLALPPCGMSDLSRHCAPRSSNPTARTIHSFNPKTPPTDLPPTARRPSPPLSSLSPPTMPLYVRSRAVSSPSATSRRSPRP